LVRTATAPPTDRDHWRRLLRLCHPDQGGDHDLFIWVTNLKEHVAGDTVEPPRPEQRSYPPRYSTNNDSRRVPFVFAYEVANSFDDLTRRAVEMAEDVEEPYAGLLRLLEDCTDVGEEGGPVYRMQHQGATWKSVAAVAYRAGMGTEERYRWYQLCKAVPMSQRHIGHILSKLE
jgi:hypothetical protein